MRRGFGANPREKQTLFGDFFVVAWEIVENELAVSWLAYEYVVAKHFPQCGQLHVARPRLRQPHTLQVCVEVLINKWPERLLVRLNVIARPLPPPERYGLGAITRRKTCTQFWEKCLHLRVRFVYLLSETLQAVF